MDEIGVTGEIDLRGFVGGLIGGIKGKVENAMSYWWCGAVDCPVLEPESGQGVGS